jgi:predicted site-specific integrase-resolvase
MLPTPRYVKPGLAEKQFGVGRRTLQKWAEAGAIRSVQPGGVGRERLYDVSSLGGGNSTTPATPAPSLGAAAEPARSSGGSSTTGNVDAVDAVYARVSTRKQLDDLGTQLGDLQRRHPDAHVFSDVGSGLNFKRKGLLSLLELAFEGRLRSVHVAHKDRLCRFAFDLLEHVFRRHGAQIVVDAHDGDAAAAASPELELAEDVLAVVTVFGARLYGKRSAGNRRKRKRDDDAAATAASGAAAEAGAQDGQGASSTDRATDGAATDGAEAQGDAGSAPAGLGWAAADLQGAHGLDSDAEADAEGLLCGGAVGVQ